MNSGDVDHEHGKKPIWTARLVERIVWNIRRFEGERFTVAELKQLARQLGLLLAAQALLMCSSRGIGMQPHDAIPVSVAGNYPVCVVFI